MDFSNIGQLTIYLILGFVLPGGCYLVVFAFAFPDLLDKLIEWFEWRGVSIAVALPGLAVIVGLLLTSLCVAIEKLFRGPEAGKPAVCRFWSGWAKFREWFPEIGMEKIGKIEAAKKSTSYLHMVSGEAIMHFNIGIGLFLIFVLYWLRLYWFPGFSKATALSIILISLMFIVLVVCNLVAANLFFKRAEDAIAKADAAQPPAGTPRREMELEDDSHFSHVCHPVAIGPADSSDEPEWCRSL